MKNSRRLHRASTSFSKALWATPAKRGGHDGPGCWPAGRRRPASCCPPGSGTPGTALSSHLPPGQQLHCTFCGTELTQPLPSAPLYSGLCSKVTSTPTRVPPCHACTWTGAYTHFPACWLRMPPWAPAAAASAHCSAPSRAAPDMQQMLSNGRSKGGKLCGPVRDQAIAPVQF